MGKECPNCQQFTGEFIEEGFDEENEYYRYKYHCTECGCFYFERYRLEYEDIQIIKYKK